MAHKTGSGLPSQCTDYELGFEQDLKYHGQGDDARHRVRTVLENRLSDA